MTLLAFLNSFFWRPRNDVYAPTTPLQTTQLFNFKNSHWSVTLFAIFHISCMITTMIYSGV